MMYTGIQVARTYMSSCYPAARAYAKLRIAFKQRRFSRWHTRQFACFDYVFRHLKGL